MTVPALVVGHGRDPLHPAADAALLADQLPDARFVRSRGILEWRRRPERLDLEATRFVLDCWRPARRARRTGAS
ncbi:hypothetical protein [Nocardioides sp. TF02-7]|uniref:hypothetical protein n=1 Tax=Nocardioides sp. TF02-7 TaxID=2917724 RepID=UPI001F052035|nr:hypothetical protein [Nocardioides sp. TF02-7]UMG92896.1 hypothetical protein MF408_00460 [Nocardioides sp. TF02-7]